MLLMRAGIITDKQLNDALEVHRATGSPLGRILVDLGYATQGAILSVMAKQIGIEYVDLSERHPEPGAVCLVTKELASRYTLMPVEIRGDQSWWRWPIHKTCSRWTICASSPATTSSLRSRRKTTSSPHR